MVELKEMMPFILPLAIVEFGLFGYALYHILTHKTYRRGSRGLWIAVVLVGMSFVGPILYFLFGREEN